MPLTADSHSHPPAAMLMPLLTVGSTFLALIGAPLSILLLVVCHSSRGGQFAIAAFCISLAPLLGCLARSRDSRFLSFLAHLLALAWVILTFMLGSQAPDGKTPATARIQHRYLNDDWRFPRLALGNLLPELDQLLLGFQLIPAFDPLLTRQQARRLSGFTSAIYSELEADPDFHALGSVLPHAYGELWLQNASQGHYFLYIPPALDRAEPAAALIFLHGSGGSFKAYPWVLSKLADDLGMVLICPGYGMGGWQERDTPHLIKSILEDAASLIPLDPRRRHLLGLSNGALGVSQAARHLGDRFASLTFISPVFDDRAVRSEEFIHHWEGRPVHIITGTADDRVPLPYVTATAGQLRTQGATVHLATLHAADHFMLFSHRPQVLAPA